MKIATKYKIKGQNGTCQPGRSEVKIFAQSGLNGTLTAILFSTVSKFFPPSAANFPRTASFGVGFVLQPKALLKREGIR